MEKIYLLIRKKIKLLNFCLFSIHFSYEIIQFLIGGLCLILIISFIPFYILKSSYKLYLIIFLIASIFLLLLKFLYKVLSFKTDKLFFLIEKKYKYLGDDLLSVIQLFKNKGFYRTQISDVLVLAFFEDIKNRIKRIKLKEIIELSSLKLNLLFLIITMFLSAILLSNKVLFPKITTLISKPYFPLNEPMKFVVTPGDIDVVFGESFNVEIRLNKRVKLPVFINLLKSNKKFSFKTFEDGLYKRKFIFRDVIQPFKYYFSIGRLRTETYNVNVHMPPAVEKVVIKTFPPPYTGYSNSTLYKFENLSVPVGTKIILQITPTKIIESAILQIYEIGKIYDIKMFKLNDNGYKTSFTALKDCNYKLILLDENNISNQPSPKYEIEIIEDKTPLVSIIEPGKDLFLSGNEKLNIKISAEDDYNLTEVYLYYAINGKNFERIKFPFSSVGKIKFNYVWDLSLLGIFSGDSILYYAVAIDNNEFSGEGVGRSSVYKIDILTPIEDFKEIIVMQDKQTSDLKEFIVNKKEIMKELGKIKNNLLESNKVSEGNKADIDKLMEKGRVLEREAEKITNELNETLKRMEQNRLINQDILSKIKKISELFKEVLTDEMKEIVGRINENLKKLDLQSLQISVDDLKSYSNNLMQSLDATLELLERIKIEQKMESIITNMENLIESQKNLLDYIEDLKDNLNKSKQREINKEILDTAKEEENILKEFDLTKSMIESLYKDLEKFYPYISSNVKSLNKTIDGSCRCLSNAANFLRKGDLNSASNTGNNALSEMISMLDKLKKFKSDFYNKANLNYQKLLRITLNNALNFSFSLEEGINDLEKAVETKSSGLKGSFENEAKRALFHKDYAINFYEDILDLYKMSIFNDRKIIDDAFTLQNILEEALMKLEVGDGVGGLNLKKESLVKINEIMVELLNDNYEGGKTNLTSEFESYLKRLEKLSQMQSNLNQDLKEAYSLMPISGDDLFSKLAHQQMLISKGIEELRKDMQSYKEFGSKLSKIKEEMEEIAEYIKSGDVGKKVQKRQSEVLRRLLDSQLSFRKSDFKEERKAEIPKDFLPLPSPELIFKEDLKIPQDYIEELKKASKYKPFEGYEEMTKEYYKNIFKNLNIHDF